MKQSKHENRKSFAKWAMEGQRTMTQSAERLSDRKAKALMTGRKSHIENIGKNNGPIKHSVPAQNNSTQFRLAKHVCLSDPMGAKAKVIPSFAYFPEPKAPSRRDRHRELAAKNAN